MDSQIFELSIVPVLQIIFHFFLIMILAPKFFSFDKRNLEFSKSVFRYLVQGVFFVVIVTYFLALIKLYEFFSIAGVYFCIYLVVRILRKRARKIKDPSPVANIPVLFLDLIGKEKSAKQVLSSIWDKVRNYFLDTLNRINLFHVIITFSLLLIAVFIRFAVRVINPMAMAAMADPYVHLTWAKMILFNRLFTDGLYPLGYNAIIATLGRMSNVDIYHVVRFIGPIGSSILIIGIYWFLKSITGKRILAIVGMIIFGFSTYNGLPVEFFRQTLSLPMEFSIAFIFPGLIFLHDYIVKGNRNDLFLYGFTIVDVVIIHSYGALFFAISSAALMFSALINRSLNIKNTFSIIVVGLSAGFIGMLPILIGKLQGIGWHTMSTSWISNNLMIGPIDEVLTGLISDMANLPRYILVSGSIILIGLLWTSIVNLVFAKKRKRLWEAMMLVLMVFVILLYFGPKYGFSLLDYTRVTMFLTICLLIGSLLFISNLIDLLEKIVKRLRLFNGKEWLNGTVRKVLTIAFLTILTASWLLAFPFQLSAEDEMAMRPIEYNSAISIYYRVKKEYPMFDWTLVAPVEQYQEALGYGFHYEIWKFNEDFKLEDAANPKFDIPIPTTNIFIYIEKVPLRIWTNNELATTQPQFRGKTEIYYRDADGRAKLEKSMWEWCEAYMKSHDNMTVFYEDEELKVYKVEHDPSKWIQ